MENSKRNLGFAPIRRGLREHLPSMSSNAVKLYLWLHLSACWSGPKRGCVEAHYEDVMRGLGWYRKLVQRSIWELARKGYIQVTPAANQHGVTLIKILKFDVGEGNSAEDTSVPTKNSAEDTAQDSAQVSGVPTSVLSRPSIPQKAQDLQAPKKSIEVKKEEEGKLDAVRRRFDAELHPATGRVFSPSEKKKKLAARIAAKIVEHGERIQDWDWSDDLAKEIYEALNATQYKTNFRSPQLSSAFLMTVLEVYQGTCTKEISPGNLCSRIIDRCQHYQKEEPNGGHYWPPDFQEHRDRLRHIERLQEKTTQAVREVRA